MVQVNIFLVAFCGEGHYSFLLGAITCEMTQGINQYTSRENESEITMNKKE